MANLRGRRHIRFGQFRIDWCDGMWNKVMEKMRAVGSVAESLAILCEAVQVSWSGGKLSA